MYIVLTKNSNDTWDAISQAELAEETISKTVLDEAFESGLPITGMDATSHKGSALKESIWNGVSFSGGRVSEDLLLLEDEYWDLNKRYVFLCNNKVVFSLVVNNESNKSEMFAAAFAGETILIKTETGPFNKVGKTFNWDGTELTLV